MTLDVEISFINLFTRLAATPSYFFQPPPQAGHHNFFFSELLRSLVQKRKTDELNAALKAKSMAKKVRKPLYHQQQPQNFQPKPQMEVQDWKKQKLNDEIVVKSDISENDVTNENSQDSVINVDKDDPPPSVPTATATTSTLPSLPNSAFYPYVDPLHFFIDLRVSAGQIYDRKKEAYLQQALKNNNILLDTNNTWNNPIIGRNRANSAFKVPGEQAQNFSAINLIQSDAKKNYKRSDDDDIEKNEDEVQIFDLDKSIEK